MTLSQVPPAEWGRARGLAGHARHHASLRQHDGHGAHIPGRSQPNAGAVQEGGDGVGRDAGPLLDRAAQRRPEAVAVVDGARRLTYAELSAQAVALGHGLRDMGIGRGDRVLIVLKNRLEHVLAYWALQTIGAVPRAGEFRLAAGELRYVLEDSARASPCSSPTPPRRCSRADGWPRAPRLRRRGQSAGRRSPFADLMAVGAAAPATSPALPRATFPCCSTRRARRAARRASAHPPQPLCGRVAHAFSAGTRGASARSGSCRSTTPWASTR